MIFRKWSAISTIAGALEQKVWVNSNRGATFAHQYILLVGGPGVGKTESIRRTMDFLGELPNSNLAPTSVSRASLIDALAAAERTIVRPGELRPVISYNSLNVCAAEFGNFLTVYEGEFMSALNHLYDGIIYSEQKRHMKKGEAIAIKNPQLNLLAGTTPGWLISTLPPQAWNEGFCSRLILIYGKGITLTDPFAEAPNVGALRASLLNDLTVISNLYGEIKYTRAAAELYTKWYLGGQGPVPTHPKLEDYNTRRARHLTKIAMALCVSRSDDLIMAVEDIETAKEFLFEAEAAMPYIFRDMNTGGDSSVLNEVYSEVSRIFIRDQRPVPEYLIIHFISKRVPAYAVRKIFEVLLDSNMIRPTSVTGPGGKPVYAPVRPQEHNVEGQ